MLKSVVKSRQFWIMLVDFFVKLIVLMLTNFGTSEGLRFWNELWLILQVPVGFLITAFTVEDVATMIALSRGGVGVIGTRGVGGSLKEQTRVLIEGVWR